MTSLSVTNLQPDTQYFYAIEADGVLDITIGKLHTPGTGAYSFTFALSSCARTDSNHPVFTIIRQHNPLFFLHMGDLHYLDISANNRDLFRTGYERVLAASNQAALYRDVPLAYMWDDHDYGPNDSDASAPGRLAARLTYQEYVPHYPLVAGSGDVPIYQAFTIGRVRFILTDTRSERDTALIPPDAPGKTMMGAAQKAWFKQELLAANGLYPLIIWVSTSPWLADPPGSGPDNWAGFQAERRELADFFAANDMRSLLMVSGDVHMLAIDNGSNNTYDTSHKTSFPIFQVSALDRPNPSYLPANNYSEGQFPGSGQFGLVTIMDQGGTSVTVELNGRNYLNETIVQLPLALPLPPRFVVAPEALTFVIHAANPGPSMQTITIIECSGENLSWQITMDPAISWLAVMPQTGSATAVAPAIVTVTIDPSQLTYGVYDTTLVVHGAAPHSASKMIPVHLLYTDQPPIHLPLVKKSA
jgi:alkaline phosphatase D